MQMNNKHGLLIAALFMLITIGGICVMSVGRAAEDGYTFQIFDFSFGRSAVLQNTIELSTEDYQENNEVIVVGGRVQRN